MASSDPQVGGPTLWECPACAFTFDAIHGSADGSGYSCPECEAAALRSRVATLEEALQRIGWHELTWKEARDIARDALSSVPPEAGTPTEESR